MKTPARPSYPSCPPHQSRATCPIRPGAPATEPRAATELHTSTEPQDLIAPGTSLAAAGPDVPADPGPPPPLRAVACGAALLVAVLTLAACSPASLRAILAAGEPSVAESGESVGSTGTSGGAGASGETGEAGEAFVAAHNAAPAPGPVEVVAVPTPLPLPGQLKPLAGSGGAAPGILMPGMPALGMPAPGATEGKTVAKVAATGSAAKTGETAEILRRAARRARQAAVVEPAEDGHVNAVQIYPYASGALYRLYASPGRVTDIALKPGERVISVSAGDTARWVVGDTASGEGEGRRTHILIKPTAGRLKTNLVIATDQRAYHLELESTPDAYMAAVSWHYPEDRIRGLRLAAAQARKAQERVADSGVSLSGLSFRYRIEGDTPDWRPLRAFDDGNKVYIQMPESIARGEAPPLFVRGDRGGTELVNYRVAGRYYVVDRLFRAAELRLGRDPQTVVRILRDDAGDGS